MTAQEQVKEWRKRAKDLKMNGTKICELAGVPRDFFPQVLRNPDRQYGAWVFLRMLFSFHTPEQINEYCKQQEGPFEPNILFFIQISYTLYTLENAANSRN
jgi:hypothetical protein